MLLLEIINTFFADRDLLEKVVHQDQVDLEESVVMEVLLVS